MRLIPSAHFRSPPILAFATMMSVAAATETLPTDPAPQPRLIRLEQNDVSHTLRSVSLSLLPLRTTGTNSAPKEPTGLGPGARRYSLPFAGAQLAMIWDSAEGKLYLDQNGNQDLADDSVLSCGDRRGFQSFDGIQLTASTAGLPGRFHVRLLLYPQAGSALGYAYIQSMYRGKLDLADQGVWEASVVVNPFAKSWPKQDATLVIRPWEEDATSNTAVESDFVPLGPQLAIQGMLFSVTLDGTAGTPEEPSFLLELVPIEAPSGEVELKGSNIARLVLDGGTRRQVLFDNPGSRVRVPADNYLRYSVLLRNGGEQANADIDRPFKVEAGQTTVLNAGGPLTNSVEITRRGRVLQLEYRLTGAGGDEYKPMQQNRANPPEVAIYQGDRRIASGRFEYG